VKQKWYEIDQVKGQTLLMTIIERIFKLFSEICEDRNFIGKISVHEYLNQESSSGVKIIITYLNIQLSPHLSNNLYALVTNCYIDSSPRINRTKPLAVILFNIEGEEVSLHEEKSYRVNLLDKQKKVTSGKSFEMSNVLTSF
jgi:hypothetical protein